MFKVQRPLHLQALTKFRLRLIALNENPTPRNQEERERLALVIAAYERLGKAK